MKLLFARLFAWTFLLATFSLLNGQDEEEPTLFVDSINLQLMTDLTIPGKDDPLKIIQEAFFRVPFSDDGVALPNDSESSRVYHSLLKDIKSGEYTFGAINGMQSRVSASLIEKGYHGIAVSVDPDQIDIKTGEDYRDEDDKSLNFLVWLGEVTEQRTIGKGSRIKESSPINHRFHERIIKNSPFSEYSEAGKFLIDKNALDDYIERLNQNARRRVDVAVSSGTEPGDIVLDYIVSESKPWTVYLQASNTGTEATGEWRERIGGIHYQLTNNDDILAFDYLTAEFDRANAVLASYEYPLIRPDYLKLRTYFKYSDFAAENLEIPTLPDSEGETFSYSSEIAYSPFYWKGHAFSASIGLLYEDIEFEASGLQDSGKVELLSPFLRFEASKQKQLHRSTFSITYEENIDNDDDDKVNLQNMGRDDSTIDHRILKFDLYQSFFIEPLLPSYYKVKKDKWLANSLVHELAFSLSGQESLNNARLITQKQFFGGGFFTVRGYNESAARGDSGLVGSAEYRIHLARLLRPASMLEEIDSDEQAPDSKVRNRFNYRAPSLYGIPDWNFLMRGFFDWASFSFIDPSASADEVEQELRSIGIGFEFQYKSNLNIRLDYGVVMSELPDFNDEVEDDADQGDSRFHFIATFSF